MGSTVLDELQSLNQELRSPSEADLKIVLSRLAMEVNSKFQAGSGSSHEFMTGAVKSLKRVRGLAHAELRINCLIDTAHYFYLLGQSFNALEPVSDAVELADAAKHRPLLRKAYTFLGIMNADTGNVSRAIECYAQALELAQGLNDLEGECSVWVNLGAALFYAAQYRDSIACLEHAIELAGANPALQQFRPVALSNIALCSLHLEDYARGLRAAETCIRESKEPHSAAEYVSRVLKENYYTRLLLEVNSIERAGERCELARRYAGKPQPARDPDGIAAEQAIVLWQALWGQYSTCLKPLLEGDPDLGSVKAKLLQRGIYVGKQLVLVYGLARRVPPAALWQELHAYFRLAEMLDCAGSAVSDPLIPNGIGISCYSTYSHALLLGLADPCAMSVKQIQLADRWLEMWARKVHPTATPRDAEGMLILVDLERPGGATLAVSAPPAPSASLRYAYAGRLATSVRGRLKRLQTGSNPAELQLGHDCSVEQCTTLLSYLDWRWNQPPRQPPAVAPSSLGLCSGGLDAAYYRVGGRTFDRRGPLRPFGAQSAQHLASLDALTDYDRGKEQAERSWAWERWEGAYEWREASLVRRGGAHYRWHLEQLVIVRDGERIRAGYVTRVSLDESGDLALTIRLWSGNPKALTMRPLAGALTEAPQMPVLLLAETPEDKACLILPARTFNPSRALCAADPGSGQRYRLTRLLQRGADFERVAFDPTT